ncbi:MAG: c-type cytochrome, partial [Planctomycetales bacterium]|nr:c-type cytochrome [Planctomycetales bacterium]
PHVSGSFSRRDSRVVPGRDRIHWYGQLEIQAEGVYEFAAYTQGEVRVTLGERAVLGGRQVVAGWLRSEAVHLDADRHEFHVYLDGIDDDGQVSLYWRGPRFDWEPLPDRLLTHRPSDVAVAAIAETRKFLRGEQLYRALHCNACHEANESSGPTIPGLNGSVENLQRDWLIDWLMESGPKVATETDEADDISEDDGKSSHAAQQLLDGVPRRMPYFALDRAQATQLAAFLMGEDVATATNRSEQVAANEQAPIDAGRKVFLSKGCLACHTWSGIGSRSLYDGGDLTNIGSKRPATFFERWLSNPAQINPNHRMPVFELTPVERQQLSVFLQNCNANSLARGGEQLENDEPAPSQQTRASGKQLFETLRCGTCHSTRESARQLDESRRGPLLSETSDWSRSCAAVYQQPDRHWFVLTHDDQDAVQFYVQRRRLLKINREDGSQVVAENNCLSCHDRSRASRLRDNLPQLISAEPALASAPDLLFPPSLAT